MIRPTIVEISKKIKLDNSNGEWNGKNNWNWFRNK
jgi:hypothetical protein